MAREGLSLAGFEAIIAAAGGRGALLGKDAAWLAEHGFTEAVAAVGGLAALAGKDAAWQSKKGLAAAVAAAGGLDNLIGASTAALKRDVVLRDTRAARASYADLLRGRADAQGAPLVGKATQFISHAYSMPFLWSVDAAQAWAARNPLPGGIHYFYFDLFVVNQHTAGDVVGNDVLWTEFAGGVRSVGHTLLVLAYNNALPLTRAWCLAEIIAGVGEGGGRFEVVMPPEEAALFAGALAGDFDSIAARTCNVLLENATAFHGGECRGAGGVCAQVAAGTASRCPDDLKFVRESVERELGFNEGNARVISVMRAWMRAEGAAALERLPSAQRDASALAEGYARLLIDLAELREAEPLILRCCDARAAAYGGEDARTLRAQQLLSYLRHKQGDDGASLALTEAVFQGRRRVLGDAHPETLCSRFFLVCGAFAEGGDGMDTEMGALGTTCGEELKRLLPRLSRALGASHPTVLAARVKWAELLRALFEMEEDDPFTMLLACEETHQALRIMRARLGGAHPKTLALLQRHAELLAASDQPREAALQYRALLPLQRRTLGPGHEETLATLDALAGIAKNYVSTTPEAIALYKELYDFALRGRVASCTVLDASRVAVEYAATLGELLQEEGRHAEAAPYLAAVALEERDVGEAERLCAEALACAEKSGDTADPAPCAPALLRVRVRVAMLAFARGEREGAAPLFEGAARAHARLAEELARAVGDTAAAPATGAEEADAAATAADDACARELRAFPVAWAEVHAQRRDWGSARALLEAANAEQSRALRPGCFELLNTRAALAEARIGAADPAAAAGALLSVVSEPGWLRQGFAAEPASWTEEARARALLMCAGVALALPAHDALGEELAREAVAVCFREGWVAAKPHAAPAARLLAGHLAAARDAARTGEALALLSRAAAQLVDCADSASEAGAAPLALLQQAAQLSGTAPGGVPLPARVRALDELGYLQLRLGDAGGAEATLRAALAARGAGADAPADTPRETPVRLAGALLAQGRLSEALPLLRGELAALPEGAFDAMGAPAPLPEYRASFPYALAPTPVLRALAADYVAALKRAPWLLEDADVPLATRLPLLVCAAFSWLRQQSPRYPDDVACERERAPLLFYRLLARLRAADGARAEAWARHEGAAVASLVEALSLSGAHGGSVGVWACDALAALPASGAGAAAEHAARLSECAVPSLCAALAAGTPAAAVWASAALSRLAGAEMTPGDILSYFSARDLRALVRREAPAAAQAALAAHAGEEAVRDAVAGLREVLKKA